MDFKIDTKTNYTTLTPVANILDANLTEAVRQKWTVLTESGSNNLIIDLSLCNTMSEDAIEALLQLHEDFYMNEQSLVFTHLQEAVMQSIKAIDEDRILNITPSFVEAEDIVNMEVLERDLLNEE